ncbi:unnamed protein product [Brachionus calyciflorus]|uniref:Beta-1,4-galactosyltransferase n=1 Tax=Brachionus calyciflorus TaxID=104777 RepID=A0A813MCV6_9BILA|nr:unnamed protein product [Brachionus calyciflorus]
MLHFKKLFKKFRFLVLIVIVATLLTTYFAKSSFYFPKKVIYRIDLKQEIDIKVKNESSNEQALNNLNSHKIIVEVNIMNKSNLSNITQNIITEINECPLIPPNLGSRLQIDFNNRSLEELETIALVNQTNLQIGGRWAPKECKPRYKVAIIVPYRDRLFNLQLFLKHMHPFLRKQQLDYGIYLIEPIANITFNRGLLMNIGFAYALADDPTWKCFVFHDVDLLPEDERNIYSCPESPRHMSSAVSTLHYKLPYDAIFGGVTEFTKEQFEKINGFSNLFFGWGGEDDDLRARVIKKGYTVSRYPLDIGRYTMAKHGKDSHNKPNPDRYKLLKSSGNRIDKDGVSSLKYETRQVIKNRLFTKILVAYNQAEILNSVKEK